MEGLADFLDAILGGIDLICFSLAIGSLFWGILILKPWQSETSIDYRFAAISVQTLYISAFALAIVQSTTLIVKAWLIAETLGQPPFPAYAKTIQFQAGVYRVLFAIALGGIAKLHLVKNTSNFKSWLATTVSALPLIISGAWLVHGAGRFDDKLLLMSLTVLHQLGAALWLGGIAQLLSIWSYKRRTPPIDPQWSVLLSRFSIIGGSAVIVLLATGIPMGWIYIQSWTGLIGTGYGNLLSVKLVLLSFVLCFAAFNFNAARHYVRLGSNIATTNRVPYFIEAEAFILISIIFTAAALSSQPPSADIPNLTASFQEVAETFKPRIPRTTSPTHQELLAGEAGRTAIIGQTPSTAATDWSDYNHNMSGIILCVMTLIGMLSYTSHYRWTQFWPLGFVGLSIFLFFRSDAESWPLGPLGFWESTLSNGEILQHRISTLLAFLLGVFEFQARKTKNKNSWLPYLFPILTAFGGLLLLTHSHIGFEAKSEFLIQIGHTLMGALSIIIACGRWLELRLDGRAARIAGLISVSGIFFIGLILMFYREPIY